MGDTLESMKAETSDVVKASKDITAQTRKMGVPVCIVDPTRAPLVLIAEDDEQLGPVIAGYVEMFRVGEPVIVRDLASAMLVLELAATECRLVDAAIVDWALPDGCAGEAKPGRRPLLATLTELRARVLVFSGRLPPGYEPPAGVDVIEKGADGMESLKLWLADVSEGARRVGR